MTFPFGARRQRALDAFAGGTAVIPAARLQARNGDSEYPFRQRSDFFYLCGLDEPDAVLVLAPHHEQRAVLFLRPRDRDAEIWNGERLGPERAVERLGIDAAFPLDELAARLPEYLTGASTLYYAIGDDDAFDRIVHEALATARARARKKGFAPGALVDPAIAVGEMRLIKDRVELDTMRRAAAITRDAHLAAMRATRPGLYEYEIRAIMEYEFGRAGAESSYQAIVAAGDNATVLHYVRSRARLEAGTLLLVDAACELECYATDVTRTWPVDGRFTAEQRAIYEVVLAAHEAACAEVRPGRPRTAFHDAAVRTITAGLIDLGILSGTVDENIEDDAYRRYYMHGTGHWLGLDVHDAGRYKDDSDVSTELLPGMVTTIEPGIYIHRDATCDERFKGIGVRIEDDLLVTAGGHENLTAAIPKRVEDLETVVGSQARTHA